MSVEKVTKRRKEDFEEVHHIKKSPLGPEMMSIKIQPKPLRLGI
eukprot:CAMPEP_0202955202 /NCGR_PEP_ID=MMETSP1395-20130829/51585_1 /ASSEMBLY_ACC=CAM_ASM_000871 /TAXON_ID=5961 /ORGANISM="Blepharisma japonicum, Strain Stock R1072" /LENGTH=43 /DNA_ID= /DNA_START= /DNA_END= /DNA_ORIENTATION=